VTPDVVLSLARDAALTTLLVAGPLLGAGLLAGLAVSVLQAVTQLQDPTLTFLPKIAAVAIVLALLGHFLLGQMVGFTTTLYANLPAYGR
jgi:flagellar biosynthetic protein FliQ